jgi:hypothetical protein
MSRFISHEYDPLSIRRPSSALVMDSIVRELPPFAGSGRQPRVVLELFPSGEQRKPAFLAGEGELGRTEEILLLN